MNRIASSVRDFAARRPYVCLMTLVLLLAIALRIWGISFGLPYVYHQDEGIEVNRALQLGTGSFDFSLFRMLKGGYFYLLFVEFGGLYVLLRLFGVVSSTNDFALLYIADPSYVYLVGRFTTAILGTTCVWLSYLIGARLQSRFVGTLSAIFLAVNVLHVEHSHYITVDIPLTCLSLASLYFCLRILQAGKPMDYIGAGVFLGLATITKLPGIVLVLPVFLAHVAYSLREHRSIAKTLVHRNILIVAALFMVVFFAGNPGALIHFGAFVQQVVSLVWHPAGAAAEPGPAAGGAMAHFAYYFGATHGAFGWWMLLAACAGALHAVLERNHGCWILMAFAACFLAAISLSAKETLVYPRYILPIVPVVAILAALGVEAAVTLAVRSPVRRNALALILGIGLAMPSLIASGKVNREFLLEDSRTLAKEWFERNVPDGSSVLIEGYSARASNAGIQLANSESNLKRAIAEFKRDGQPGKARYFGLELRVKRAHRYDLIFYNWRNMDDWSTYRPLNVDYVVVRPSALLETGKYRVQGERLLGALRQDPEFVLAAFFEGNAISQRGPSIEIYRRK
jgi:hypothetical protein